MNKVCKVVFIFVIGATVYPGLELLSRGYTHWSMSIAGGLCFLSICIINSTFTKRGALLKCISGAVAITIIEFITGCIVNRLLHWNVWDYSHLPLNVLGQVCIPFTLIWLTLCLPAIKIASLIERLFDGSGRQNSSEKG